MGPGQRSRFSGAEQKERGLWGREWPILRKSIFQVKKNGFFSKTKTCLQLYVLFNFQICGTFPPVFMNIFLRSRLTQYKCVVSAFIQRPYGEFETGLFSVIQSKS